MNIAQKAKENFLNGLSCSEAVVKTVKDDEGMIKIPDEVLRIASAFKAGIGCKGDVCGALLGAILIIGIKYGRVEKNEDIKMVNKKTAQFYNKFKEKFNSVYCRDLTKEFREKQTLNSKERKKFCAEIVGFVSDEINNKIKHQKT